MAALIASPAAPPRIPGSPSTSTAPPRGWASEEERHAALVEINAIHFRATAIAVRHVRIRFGDTVPAFAQRCGVDPRTIRRWEAGARYDSASLYGAFRRIRVDLNGLAVAVTRGYAAAVKNPWFDVEDLQSLGA